MVGETTQSRWKGGPLPTPRSGVVVYVGKDEMGGKVVASDGQWGGRAAAQWE